MNSDIQTVEKLINEIKRHNNLYYIKADPEISDQEYDALLDKLKKIESEHPELKRADSPTNYVGSDITNKFESISHSTPMLSIENTYNFEDLDKFNERLESAINKNDVEYLVEMKIDGCSISIIYQDGILLRAVTRGDGKVGEDVTNNVKHILDIPNTISLSGINEFRGEIYMSFDTFNSINNDKIKNLEEPLRNPRNAAAGALKRKNPKESAKSKLSAFIYDYIGTYNTNSQEDILNLIKHVGFKVEPNYKKCNKLNLKQIIDEFNIIKNTLNYPTDGAVVKLNNLKDRMKVGFTSKHPKWLTAYKFAAEIGVSKVLRIEYQVGKSGIISPVCYFEPIELCGTTVKKATLCNFDYLNKIDIRVGDTIEIQKAGEIIPQVIRYIPEYRRPDFIKIQVPLNCPDCNSLSEKVEDSIYIKCSNDNCPSVLKNKIEYFANRDNMNIDGMGEKIISQLVDKNLVKTVWDIYYLKKHDLLSLDRMAEKSVDKILKNIKNTTRIPFEKVLAAICIPNTGHSISKLLAYKFKNIDNLMNCNKDDLSSIEGIGDKTADTIINYFKRSETKEFIEKLKENNIQLEIIDIEKSTDDLNNAPLKGMSFVVTGSFQDYSRNQIEEIIVKNGGSLKSSVSKNTTYLVVGSDPGSSKIKKANDLNISKLNEFEFFKLLG